MRGQFRHAFVVLLFPVVPAGFCQGLHVGVKAGVPLTQYFETGAAGGRQGSAEYSAATRRYTAGVTAEWRFADSLGVEVDTMYHRMGYVAIVHFIDSASGSFHDSAIDVKGNSWDFPLLAKYRFGWVGKPYVAAGPALRVVGPVRGRGKQTDGSLVTRQSSTRPLDTGAPSELRKRIYPGVTATAGFEIPAGRFRVLPEFRYTRWTANISAPGGLLRFASNQAEVLLGISF